MNWSVPWVFGELPLTLILKCSLVIVFAWLVSKCLKKIPAAGRHLVWCLAIVAVLMLPLASLILPEFELHLLPVETASAMGPESHPEPVVAVVPSVPLPERAAPHAVIPEAAFAPVLPRLFLLVFYGAGVFGLLGYLVLGLVRLHLGVRGLPEVSDPDLQNLCRDLCRRGGIGRAVRLIEHPSIITPVTFGLFRPVILLPEGAGSWDPLTCRDVLSHELSHVKRLDWLTHLFARATCALHWYNPLVWLAARCQAEEAEFACDDFVLAEGGKASDYAEHLLFLARQASRSPMHYAAVGMASGSELSKRVTAILDPRRGRRALSRRSIGLFLASMVLVMTPLAAFKAVPVATANTERLLDQVLSAPVLGLALKAQSEKGRENVPSAPTAAFHFRRPTRYPSAPGTGIAVTTLSAPSATMDRLEPALKPLLPLSLNERKRGSAVAAGPTPAGEAGRALLAMGGASAVYGEALVNNDTTRLAVLPPLHGTGELEALSKALRDPRPGSRRIALRGLGYLSNEVSRSYLIEALGDPHESVRADAVLHLTRLQESRALARVRGLAHDPAPGVRGQVARFLAHQGRLDGAADLALLASDPDPAVTAIAIPACRELLDGQRVRVLTRILDPADPNLCEQVILALGRRRAPRSFATIKNYVDHPHQGVRRAAALAMGQLGHRQAVPLLQRLAVTEGEPLVVRLAAIQAIGRIERGNRLLQQLAVHDSWRVRESAVTGLGYSKESRGILKLALADDHPKVREAARLALSQYPHARFSMRPRWDEKRDIYGEPTSVIPLGLTTIQQQ